ncbi:helix-turn-helix domain-containing protein [Staphylococcus simulans]
MTKNENNNTLFITSKVVKYKGDVKMRNNLSTLMGAKKVKISELSKETGISQTTIRGLYYERTNKVEMRTILKICEYFKVTPNELLGIEPIKELSR